MLAGSKSTRCGPGVIIKRHETKIRESELRPEVIFESREGHAIRPVVKEFCVTYWRSNKAMVMHYSLFVNYGCQS